MADHREVSEVSLNARLHDRLGPSVAERGPVLVQEVHQLLADEPETSWHWKAGQSWVLVLLGGHQEIFPPVDVTVLPAEELGHWSGGELCLTDVAEVPGEVDGLPLHQAGQQGHVGRLPPPGRECHTQFLQLLS